MRYGSWRFWSDRCIEHEKTLSWAQDLFLEGDVDPAGLQRSGDMVRQHLKKEKYDVVLIGAGIRGPPSNFPLFEHLMNIAFLELFSI